MTVSHDRQMFELLSDGVWQVDAAGKTTYVNARMAEMVGRSREQFVALPSLAFVGEQDRSWIAAKIASRRRGVRDDYECRLAHADGSWVDVMVQAVPLFRDDGEYDGTSALVTNLAEQRRSEDRKRAEEALRESEERFKELFTSAPLGVALIDSLTGHFYEVNPMYARIAGRTTAELRETDWMQITHPDDVQEDLDNMALLNARTVDGFQMEKRYLHPEGTVVWINMTIARASAADEAHPRHLCMIEDITARKRAAEEKARLEGQLHQAQKMESVGRLAGGVAHDFNNMLAVILGHGELVRDRLEPTSALRENMGELLEATQRSAALTRQLLAFARKQAVVPLVLDLNDSVASILTMLGRLLGANIQLAWLPGANVGPVYMDASQLDQVLTNLCVNARDAISGVGKLTVATRSVALDAQQCESHPGLVPGDYVRLTVRDDGSGMDKETQSHLFEPFFTTKGVGEGTGLGLATVHGIVTQNHGVIDVESELGHGTTFTILLPRHDGMAGHAAARVAALTVRGHETILVVEDEPSILRVTKTMLEQMGYVVLTAGTPAEALRQAEQHGPEIHLLLTDVVMPEMSGPDLAKKLLSLHPHLKALFMSGFPAHLNAQRGLLENGDFLQKPFSNAELAARMRQALDARSKPS